MSRFEHKTVLSCLCFEELFRQLGWLERDFRIAMVEYTPVYTVARLEVQGKRAEFFTGYLNGELEGISEPELMGLLTQAKDHYTNQDNTAGPLRKYWEMGAYETQIARLVRRRCGNSGIFMPPSTLVLKR